MEPVLPVIIIPKGGLFTPESNPSTLSSAKSPLFVGTDSTVVGEFSDLNSEGIDFGLLSGMNQGDNRANNQTAFQSIRNGFSQLISGALGEIVATPGYVAGLFEPIEQMDKGFSSLFIEAGEWIKKQGEEFAPVYQSEASAQKVFAPFDSEWLAKTVADFGPTVALMATAIATEGLTTPRLLSMLSKVPKVGEYAKLAALLKNESTLYKALRAGNSALMSRTAESGMEAYQSFKETYEKLVAENPEMSDEEARRLAGEAGSKVYRRNWGLIALDFIQYHGLLNGFGKFGGAFTLATEMGSEAFEEGIQFAFQQEAKDDIDFKLGKIDQDKGVFDTFIDNLSNTEMQKAMVQGALGGAVFMGAGKLMDKITDKYRQPVLNSIVDVVSDAAKKGDLNALEADVDFRIQSVETPAEQKTYLEGVKNTIAKYKQVLDSTDSPYKHEVAKMYALADEHAKVVQEQQTVLDKIKGDNTFTNASSAVLFAEAGEAPNTIGRLRKKYSGNPLAQGILDKIEAKYEQQLKDSTTPTSSADARKVLTLVKPLISKKIENEFHSEFNLELGSEVASGNYENFQDTIKQIEKQQIQNEKEVDRLFEIANNTVDKELATEARNEINKRFKVEDKNVPEDINQLPEFYSKNPVTFLKDKRDVYKIDPKTTVEEFTTLLQTPEFQEKFNRKAELKKEDTKTKEKAEDVKQEIERQKAEKKEKTKKPEKTEKAETIGTLTDEDTISAPEAAPEDFGIKIKTEAKEEPVVEGEVISEDAFTVSQDQSEQEDKFDETPEWKEVNADRLRTADAVTYSYDDGVFTIGLFGNEKLTEEEFDTKYEKGKRAQGFHVLYDKQGQVVFFEGEKLIDIDFIRHLAEEVGKENLYTIPVTLSIDGDYRNGNFINERQDHNDIVITASINGKVIGKLPATSKVAEDQRGEFEVIRKQIYDGWKQAGEGMYNHPVTTTLKTIIPGRFWRGPRTRKIGNKNEKPILGVVKKGILSIPNTSEIPAKEKEELATKFKLSDGSVYWMLKNPTTGEWVPYRLFTKKVREVEGKEMQIKNILAAITPQNFATQRRKLQEIVRWKDSKERISPDFSYVDGKLIAKLEDKKAELTIEELYDFFDLSDRTLQIDDAKLNDRNYNDSLIEQGYFEATLNEEKFHSPAFIINLDALKEDNKSKGIEERIGSEPMFKRRDETETYPVWNEKEETQWFKDRLGSIVDLNVVDEAELDSIVESLKHIHGQDNLKAWGFFHNAAIWISKNTKKGVLYHEAYHAIESLVLSKSQVASLNRKNTEEERADLFMTYMELAQANEIKLKQTSFFKQLGARIQRLFRKMYLAIKAAIGLNLSQEEIFFRINAKSYKNFTPRKAAEQFKPKVRAYIDPVKQQDRVNLVNRYFLARYNDFKKKVLKDKPNTDEKTLLNMAISPTSKDNIYKGIAKLLYSESQAVLGDKKTQEQKDYLSKEFAEASKLLYDTETQTYGPLFENAVADLKQYGVRIKPLKDTIEVAEEETTKEMWLEVDRSPYESFTSVLKEGLGTLIQYEFSSTQRDENGFRVLTKEDIVRDDLGFQRHVNGVEAYNKLMEIGHGSLSVEDMMSRIKELADEQAWAIQLYNVLSGSVPSNVIVDIEQFKSLLYVAMQSASPQFKYLLQYFKGRKVEWRLGNSSSKTLAEKLKSEWLTNLGRPTNKLLKNGTIDAVRLEKVKKKLETKNNVLVLHNILNGIGINIPKGVVEKIVAEDAKNLQKWTEQIINSIDKYGEDVGEKKKTEDAVVAIAKMAKSHVPEYHQSSHTSVENETINNYIRNSFMNRQIQKFKRTKEIFDWYRTDDFYEANTSDDTEKDLWLDSFQTDNVNKLEFGVVDGIKYANNQASEFSDMTSLEFATFTLNAFYNNNNGVPNSKGKGRAFYSAQILSDSGSHALIGFESYDKDIIIKKLEQVVKREWNAILQHRANPVNVKGNEPKLSFIPAVTEEIINDSAALQALIEKELNKVHSNLVQELKESGFITRNEKGVLESEYLDGNIKDIDEFLKLFVYNDYFAQTQIVSLFHGKLFMYGNINNFYKRAKEIWSPGNFINADHPEVGKNYFTFVVKSNMLDYASNPTAVDDIMSNMRKTGIEEQIVLETGAKYGYTDGTIIEGKPGTTLPDGTKILSGEVDTTDGQGIIDIHRWKEISLGKGIDAMEVNRVYDAVVNDTYTVADLSMIFNSLKPFYYELIKVDGVVVPFQVKNSEFVLLPQLARGNPELENILETLRKAREVHGMTGSINFDSAIKVGVHNVHNTVSDIKIENAIILNNEDYRIQGEVPEHQVDTTNRLGSQLRKLILGELSLKEFYEVAGKNLTGEDIKREWNQLLIADTKEAAQLLKETFDSPEKFYELLQEEAETRDYSDKFVDALELVDGKPVMALTLPMLYKKATALISSIYRNKITKMTFMGAAVPNVISYGLERKPQIVYNEKGGISHFEAYLPLTSKWLTSYMDENGFLNAEKLEELGLDTGVAYRIPTEGKYSMIPIKIIGFSNSGIILPELITKVQGLDFDIDKMFVLLYSFDTKWVNNTLVPVKVKWKSNPKYEDYVDSVEKTKKAKQILKKIFNETGILTDSKFSGEEVEVPVSSLGLHTALLEVLNYENIGESEVIQKITEQFFNEGYTTEDLLIEEGMLLDEAEWNKLSVYEKNTRKARDNRKLDIIRAVLTDTKTLQSQIVPGGFVELEKEAGAIAEAKGLDKQEINPMTLSGRLTIFERMSAGRKLVGIPANYLSTHALMQDSGMELTSPVRFNGQEGKNLGQRTILDKTTTITSDLGQFVASILDNGKNPLASLYNFNSYTADVILLITKFFGKETAMNFSAQPIIVEFYKRYSNYGSDRMAELKAGMELLGISRKDYYNMLKDYITPDITDAQLKKGLKDKYYSAEQKEMLKTFLFYKKNQAKDLGLLVNAIKVPDAGARSTLEKTIIGIDRIREAKKLKTITNVGVFLSNEEFINTTLYEKGIVDAMNKFVELGFPDYLKEDENGFTDIHEATNSSAYVTLRNYFSSQKNERLNEKELTLMHDTLMSYLSSSFTPLANINRNEVILETPKLLNEFIESNPTAYAKLVGSLRIQSSKEIEGFQIITLESNQSKDIENDIINEWETLLDSPIPINDTYTQGDLAKMLIEYAFISNGFRFAPGSLAHIQPISFYQRLTDENGKSYNDFMLQQIDSANNDSRYLNEFISQFVKHYFPRLSFVRAFDKDSASIKYLNQEPYAVTLDSFEDSLFNGEMPDYIKVKEKDAGGKKEWYLFKNEPGTTDYFRIGTLGLYREFEEWSFDVVKPSLFKQNNVSNEINDAYLKHRENRDGFTEVGDVVEPTAKESISNFEKFQNNFEKDCKGTK